MIVYFVIPCMFRKEIILNMTISQKQMQDYYPRETASVKLKIDDEYLTFE